MTNPRSQRTTLRRGKNRGNYDSATIAEILDRGFLAHVGVTTDDGPVVLPMIYGRDDTYLYLHGALANAMMKAGRGVDICVTVTIVDGLVIARSPLHNSMNYRSVVVRGEAEPVDDEEDKIRALKLMNDHIVATWDQARPPSAQDLRATQVMRLRLDESSAKIRTGPAVDEDADIGGPHWAGVVPLHTKWGAAQPNPDLARQIAPPQTVLDLEGADAHPSS